VEVLVEQQVVAPVRILLELPVPAVDGTPARDPDLRRVPVAFLKSILHRRGRLLEVRESTIY
jgi:hypothetical protein